MRLGIMQPYFFPYIGYFSLIKNTDHFILLDDVQFIRHGWIERNRMLKENGGWLYIQVPVIKGEGRNTKIKNVKINNNLPWREKIFSQIKHYKKIAPNYYSVLDLLRKVFAKDYEEITCLNKSGIEEICNYLGFPVSIEVFSKANLFIEGPKEADDWAFNICKKLGNVKEYWNPTGGRSFFNVEKFEKINVTIKFPKISIVHYNQRNLEFQPSLSILDALMFNQKNEVLSFLDNFEF